MYALDMKLYNCTLNLQLARAVLSSTWPFHRSRVNKTRVGCFGQRYGGEMSTDFYIWQLTLQIMLF
jgi:hypothetical protein